MCKLEQHLTDDYVQFNGCYVINTLRYEFDF